MNNQILIATKSVHYPFIVMHNAIDRLPEMIDPMVKKMLIVTDERIASYHRPKLQVVLERCPCSYTFVELPAGEDTKSFIWLERLLGDAIASGLNRSSMFVAFGGGVIGDLTGFAASIFMRGIPYIQIPTTLLAHDSSIGGKVAINHELGKNLIGSFYHPQAVLFDLQFLSTLDERTYISGFAEMIKHAVIGDAHFFAWLEQNVYKLLERDIPTLQKAILWSASIKAAIVQQDEQDLYLRQLLNYGHTIGHAIETMSGYELLHGEAVSIGMVFENKIAAQYCQFPVETERIESLLQKFCLPTSCVIDDKEAILKLIKRDKKVKDGELVMALPLAIGKAEVIAVKHRWVQQVLQ